MSCKTIEVKGRLIGGTKPLICMPIVARNYDELMLEAGVMLTAKPDLIEWRADYYGEADDINKVLTSLDKLTDKLKDFPIIFTLRTRSEGGYQDLEQGYRVELIKEVIKTRKIDIVDYELCNSEDHINEVLLAARENGVYVILSYHDFKNTPPKEEIIAKLIKAQDMGADISKIAVMPGSTEDLLTLLQATLIMKEKYTKVPMVTMSMSQKGLLSRLTGGIFGSSITFAAGRDASAPGQIALHDLRNVIDIIDRNSK
jgi:3-dehydroquinate dehydratase-1